MAKQKRNKCKSDCKTCKKAWSHTSIDFRDTSVVLNNGHESKRHVKLTSVYSGWKDRMVVIGNENLLLIMSGIRFTF